MDHFGYFVPRKQNSGNCEWDAVKSIVKGELDVDIQTGVAVIWTMNTTTHALGLSL